MGKMKRMLSGALAASALAVGLSFAAAPAAQALPGSCATGWASDSKAYGNCSTGTGQYRIGIPCKTILTAFHSYSSWKNVGQPAEVGCPFGSWVWWDITGGPQILVEKRN